MGRRHVTMLLAGILAAAALLRALHLDDARRRPDFTRPQVDAEFHDYWARGLAFGDWRPPEGKEDPRIAGRPFFRPPGYPYFLAGVYALTGGSHLAARIALMLVGLATVWLLFAAGRRAYGVAEGLCAAALAASYWGFVYFEAELQAEALFIALLVGATAALLRWRDDPRARWLALAGLALGAATLVRPNALALLPVVAWWIMRRRHGRRRCWRGALLVAACALLAIAPATLRNYRVSGELVLVTTNGGVNLFMGNNPRATGQVIGDLGDYGWFGTCFDYDAVIRAVEAQQGRPLSDAQVSAFFADRAVDYALANPARTAELTLRKAALFWGPTEVTHNKAIELERRSSRVLARLPVTFPIAATAGVFGFALLVWRRRRGGGRAWDATLLLAALPMTYFATVLPFFVAGRYRQPVVPFLLLLAGYAIVRSYRIVRSFEPRRGTVAAAALAAIAFAFNHAWVDYRPNYAHFLYQEGIGHERLGRTGAAERFYWLALAVAPDRSEIRPVLRLAKLALARGDRAGALDLLEGAVAANPGSPLLRRELARVYLDGGDRASLARGVAELEQAVRLSPENGWGHYHLASARARLGDHEAAARGFREAQRLARKRGDLPLQRRAGAALARR